MKAQGFLGTNKMVVKTMKSQANSLNQKNF
jgi:hypothetical protein